MSTNILIYKDYNSRDSFDTDDSVDVLVGSDYYWSIVGSDTVRSDMGPVAVESKFGWVLSGPTND